MGLYDDSLASERIGPMREHRLRMERKALEREAEETARKLGEQAYHRGAPSAPVLDGAFMTHLGYHLPLGVPAGPLLDAWTRGWHGENAKKFREALS